VDVPAMIADGKAARDGRPVLGVSRLDRESIDALTSWVRSVLASFRSGTHVAVDPGPMAPHFHAIDEGQGYTHAHEHADHPHQHAGPATTRA
jgi:urease accessory protein